MRKVADKKKERNPVHLVFGPKEEGGCQRVKGERGRGGGGCKKTNGFPLPSHIWGKEGGWRHENGLSFIL